MKLNRASILHKALLAVAVILLPVIITFAVTYVKSSQYLRRFAVDDLTVMAEAFEGQVYQFLEMSRRRARDFSSDRKIREMTAALVSGDKAAVAGLSRYLTENKLPLDKSTRRICVISLEGKVLTSTDTSHVGKDISTSPYFKRIVAGDDVAETRGSGGDPEIAVASEINDPATGAPLARLFNFISLTDVGDVLSGRHNRDLGALSWGKGKKKSMETYLVNRDRLMLTQSLFVKDAPLNQRVDTVPVRECLERGVEMSAFYKGYIGEDVVGASMCLPQMGWVLIVEAGASEMLAPLREIRRDAFAGAVVVAGLIGALLFVFYRKIVVRLRLISSASAALAGGDCEISLPEGSGDEIGFLSRSFNSMARDIRDRERRLGESEEKYRSLVSNIPDVIWTAGAGSETLFISFNAAEVLGYSAEEIISTPGLWTDSIHGDDVERVRAAYGALFYENSGYGEEYRFRRKDGRWIWVFDRAAGVYEKDGVFYADGVLSDITGRKAAEERAARLTRLYSVLTKISEAIVRIRDIQSLYETACRIAVDDGKFSLAWVGAVDPDSGATRPVACYGQGAASVLCLAVPLVEAGGGAQSGGGNSYGEPVISNDIETDGRMEAVRGKALELGLRSLASVPLFMGGKAIGAINLYSAEPGFFNAEEIKLVESLAADISFAVESVENERLGKKADEELLLLQRLSISIRDASDFHSALNMAITGLCRAAQWTLSEAWMPSKGGEELVYALSCGCRCEHKSRFHDFEAASSKVSFKPGEGVPGRVWMSKKPLWLTDITTPGNLFLRSALAQKAGLRAEFAVPIIEGTEVLAVVVFFMEQPRVEDKRLINFVTAACAQLGPVLRRKMAEEARAEIERRYERLVNNLTVGVYRDLQGSEGRIIEANSAMMEMLEAPSRKLLLGRRMSDFFYDPNKRRELGEKMREQGFIRNEDVEMVTFGGRRLWASITAVMKKDDKGQRYYDGIVEDITGRKKLEAQLMHAQKMEAVGQLAGGVAHDFNNILTALIGYGNLLIMKRGEDELVKSYAGQMLSLSEKAANLTQGLLAFSRKQEITVAPVDLGSLLRRVEKILQRVIGEDVDIRITHSPSEINIRGDSTQIEHVMMNLATNARDAMPAGGVISIKTELADIDDAFITYHGYGSCGRYALITFADNGSGMDGETLRRLFEPFYTTKEVGKGTGLGLSMAYGIIKQHNGFIEVRSELGKGTVFLIYLPLASSGKPAAGRVERPAPGGTETILLAEDQDDVRDITGALLEEYGYSVIYAVDGEEAVKLFMENRERIDLVMLDMVMPKKNGKEALEEITQAGLKPRVIFTSGYAEDVMKARGITQTGAVFVSKPVSPIVLLTKIREVLDK